jgi:hypothetical protein
MLNKKYQALYNKMKTDLEKAIAMLRAQDALANPPVTPPAPPIQKRALLIGINYIGTPYELNGCINDVNGFSDLLSKSYGYTSITIINDTTATKPTRENILSALNDLFVNTKSGDQLFLVYSGHGTQTWDTNGDETDGIDEAIVSSDMNIITDDEIKAVIMSKLIEGVSLMAVFDSCNSGTVMDLKYQYVDTPIGTNVITSLQQETAGNVYCISGCADEQTSADAFIGGKFTGALTWSIMNTIKTQSGLSWIELIRGTRDLLKRGGYSQIPQLTTGKHIDFTQKSVF